MAAMYEATLLKEVERGWTREGRDIPYVIPTLVRPGGARRKPPSDEDPEGSSRNLADATWPKKGTPWANVRDADGVLRLLSSTGTADADDRGSPTGTADADDRGSPTGTADADNRGSPPGTADADDRGSPTGTADADFRGSPFTSFELYDNVERRHPGVIVKRHDGTGTYDIDFDSGDHALRVDGRRLEHEATGGQLRVGARVAVQRKGALYRWNYAVGRAGRAEDAAVDAARVGTDRDTLRRHRGRVGLHLTIGDFHPLA